MELRQLLRVITRRWVVIVAAALVGAALGLVYALTATPVYQATAKSFVSTSSAASVTDLSQGSNFSEQIVKSYAAVATAPRVLNPVIQQLGLEVTASELSSQITATPELDTVVLDIAVVDTSPARAAAIANAVSSQLSIVVTEITPDGTNNQKSVKVSEIQAATTPTTPNGPRAPLYGLVGLIGGILVGLAIAAIRHALDTKLRSASDIAAFSEKPVIGAIAFDNGAKTEPLITHGSSNSPRAEAFRSLRTNLRFLSVGDQPRAYVITSSIPAEGKSTSAANLACTIANAGQSVLIIDADLRRPKLADYFALDGSTGLTDVLIGTIPLDEAVQSWGLEGLSVLPAGTIPPNPSELLQSPAMVEILTAARAKFDVVLLDAPPLLPVTDAAILAKIADGAIVVGAVNHVHRQQLRGALAVLERVGASVLGIVVTMVKLKADDSYGYGQYSYGYTSYASRPTAAAEATRPLA